MTASVAGLAWSLIYRKSLGGTIYIILRMIFRPSPLHPLHPFLIPLTEGLGDFILTSLVIATILYLLTNRLLLAPSAPHAAVLENRVEWSYAFDVAVNSFFPAFLTTYVALLPLAAVVVRNNWVCLFFGK
jgi:predicted nucleic acid-binding protein